MNDMAKIKPRAGHSMTNWEDKLFIMGGSYGQQYYKDFYIIDTSKLLFFSPLKRLVN